MSKMAELDAAVAELRRCGEALSRVSETLRDLFSGSDEQQTDSAATPNEPAAKALVLEDVRSVLAQKSVEGHTAEVQALIRKYDADKLSQVDPAHYADLLRDAEVL
ncbi:MAG: DNA ligase [Candidatus Limiplasma sp.]|nr:DNA ligase [Candidatus Limiplasma sp.]